MSSSFQEPFTWGFEETKSPGKDTTVAPVEALPRWKSVWLRLPAPLREVIPYVSLVALLLILLASRGMTSAGEKTDFKVEALVPFAGLAKGEVAEVELFKEVGVDRRDLSKSQLLQLVRVNDLASLRGKVRARRDLPPGRPLFWTDLAIERAHKGYVGPTAPVIQYGRDL